MLDRRMTSAAVLAKSMTSSGHGGRGTADPQRQIWVARADVAFLPVPDSYPQPSPRTVNHHRSVPGVTALWARWSAC